MEPSHYFHRWTVGVSTRDSGFYFLNIKIFWISTVAAIILTIVPAKYFEHM